MLNTVSRFYTFADQCPPGTLRSDATQCSEKTPLPTGGDASAKPMIVRPILPQDRKTNDRRTIAWPTNIQSRTPDGQFGPAKQINGWGDCWFLSSLAAVANNEQGRQILAGSIKQVNIAGIRGYGVTFKAEPDHTVFISEQELTHSVDEKGGDADTRLLELAADRFFSVNGRFQSLFIAALMHRGLNQNQAEQCFNKICQNKGVRDPKGYNPMRDGCTNYMAFFMFTGVYPDVLSGNDVKQLQPIDIMAYLNNYVTNSQDGPPISIGGIAHPLGNTAEANELVKAWDVIRTEITANGAVGAQEQAFLNALARWLETPGDTTWQALDSAAKHLKLKHYRPLEFLYLLKDAQINLRPNHRDRLRSGIQAVLSGRPGHIGFPGTHGETLEGINVAQNTFTYSEPNHPTLVHTGELPGLFRAIANGHVSLTAFKPATGPDAAESSHAGEKRGRHLLAFHRQVVKDGKIDSAESRPLANLMAMDDGTFQYVYDSDHNGVIQGSELKAVQLRVDRWVNRLTLMPIW